MVYLYLTSSTLHFCQTLLLCTINLLNSVTTHLREVKKVRILSQLRESDLPVGDASRMLPSSSGLLEVLPIYQLLVDYIGSKVYSVSWGSLTFPSAMRTERCAQAVAYLSCCQYTDHQSIILGVKELVNTLSRWRMLMLAIRRKIVWLPFP